MKRTPGFALVAFLLVAGAAWPQGTPLGPEFRVNTYTMYDQSGASVASDSSGNFVVVWASDVLQNPDTEDVRGQRYSEIVPVELIRFGVE